MRITIEMVGAMKKPLGQGPVELEVGEGTTVERLMEERLGYSPAHVGFLSFFMNGKSVKPSEILTPGCNLKVLMIIGGG